MEIIAFEPELAPGLAWCYNELVAPVPHHRPAPAEWFGEPFAPGFQDCTEEAVLVAREGREVVGFTHVGVSAPPAHVWHAKGEPGVIRFLSYRPGERRTGEALLARAEAWLRARERREVLALAGLHMYPFYPLQLSHISERCSHLLPLLRLAGYEDGGCEVFFHWPDFVPPQVPQPECAFDLVREQTVTAPHLEVVVRAMREDRELGHCIMWLLTDPYRPQLDGWCTCEHLLVEEALRGQGLGRYLLARGLAEMHAAGACHAMINTDWDSYRAYLFYTNLGYRFLDRTFGSRKRLE